MTNKDLVKVLREVKKRAEQGLWSNYDSNRMDLVIVELDETDPYEISDIMNPPEGNHNIIDLCTSKQDYRSECERLAMILETVTREKDEYEKELHRTQLSLEMCKGKLRAIKGVIA